MSGNWKQGISTVMSGNWRKASKHRGSKGRKNKGITKKARKTAKMSRRRNR